MTIKDIKVVRHAFNGWDGGGYRPLNRPHPFTQQKIKDGKTLYYEVTHCPDSHTRHYSGKYQTLATARKHARRIASKEGAASEIFRWYETKVFTDGTRNPKRMNPAKRHLHIETWRNKGDFIKVEEY